MSRPSGPCNCRIECMDADDEDGVCKGLPEPPRQPLVEFIVVPRWPALPEPEPAE